MVHVKADCLSFDINCVLSLPVLGCPVQLLTVLDQQQVGSDQHLGPEQLRRKEAIALGDLLKDTCSETRGVYNYIQIMQE